MNLPKPHLLVLLLVALISGCEKGTDDGFPETQFTGIFNLNDPLYSGDSFSATVDLYGNWVGLAGIIVYRVSATEYYAYERMCPNEKKLTCRALIDPEENPYIAECECCGSQFLITTGYGDIVEGPSTWPLKAYQTSVQGSMLVVSSY